MPRAFAPRLPATESVPMCGLTACFQTAATPLPLEPLARALDRMRHRGPDDEGLWHDEGVSLGHRRLAILDLDRRSAQPMHSHCRRYVAVLNGEIYNFAALRVELQRKGIVFRTTSDTEVLLALFAQEGEAMLPKLHGMFAFVIWDKLARRAFAARDPYGIKPLYVARTSHGVVLGSQVKALLATGLVSREPDLRGQAGFWLLGSVPEPHTWYRDIRALPAGHCAWIADGRMGEPRCWCDIGTVWRTAPECRLADADIRTATRAASRARSSWPICRAFSTPWISPASTASTPGTRARRWPSAGSRWLSRASAATNSSRATRAFASCRAWWRGGADSAAFRAPQRLWRWRLARRRAAAAMPAGSTRPTGRARLPAPGGCGAAFTHPKIFHGSWAANRPSSRCAISTRRAGSKR